MSYTAESIAVLKGLEPVRHRPGMYTRTDCPLHIIQEAIDNAADEALGGYCKRISVTLHRDHSVTVQDDGRGIPVEMHPLEKVPTLEVVFTRLHAGGKFNKDDGASAYRFSGGLHGVGVSVTNALSTRLEVEVVRDGARHRMAFAGGEVVEPLQRVGDAPKKTTGTRLRAWPDPAFFDTPAIPLAQLERLLRSKALLLPGLQVSLSVEDGATSEWCFANGMLQYLAEQIDGEAVAPVFSSEKYAAKGDENFPAGSGAAWAICWTAEGGLARESYVNLIPTTAGGTHEAGLRQAALDAIRSFAEHHALLPKGVKLAAEDVFSRASFVLAVRMLDPSFQGQTKERLNSRDAVALVARMLRDPLELWLNEHPEAAKRITDLAIRAAQARTRAGQKVEKRKQSGVAILPGKLSDCQSEDVNRNEIFLVEGDSAGGSAKSGRDKELQAILPLRGKVLEHLGGRGRQPVRQPRSARYRRGARHRSAPAERAGFGADQSALWQGGDHDRCRRRWLAYPRPAVHALLPPFSEADCARPSLLRPAAALSSRRAGPGQESSAAQDLCARQRRARSVDRSSAPRGRQAGSDFDLALQGTG
jgi:topoisomerase-4 subunit B